MAGFFLSKNPTTRKKQLKNRTKFAKFSLTVGVGCSLIYLLVNQFNFQSKSNVQLSIQNSFQNTNLQDLTLQNTQRSRRSSNETDPPCDSRCEFINNFTSQNSCGTNATSNCLQKVDNCKDTIVNTYCNGFLPSWENCTGMVESGIYWCDSNEFPEDYFTIEERRNGAVVFHFLGLFYMFVALAIVCDEYFVPSLEMISDKLDLSDDVAGATFMAAGGSAPELFTSLIGVFVADSNVGIGTIVGSAVFNILFVIGACAFVVGFVKDENGKPTVLSLTWFPLTRDCCFYIIALSVLIYNFSGDTITAWESVSMLSVYVCYVSFMMFNSKIEEKILKKPKVEDVENIESDEADDKVGNGKFIVHKWRNSAKEAFNHRNTIMGLTMASSSVMDDSGRSRSIIADYAMARFSVMKRLKSQEALVSELPESESNLPKSTVSSESRDMELLDGSPWKLDCPSMESGCFGMFIGILCLPLIICLKYTIPDTRFKSIRGACGGNIFILSFFLSIMWISIFSWFMVWMATRIGETYNIDAAMMGLTFLAAGTSVPDLITSVIVAKDGHGDMAVSSSIGSNIFDVTIGLPLPWLLYSAFNGWASKSVDSSGMVCNIGLLLLMLIVLVVTILATNWKMNHILGFAMIALYGVFVWISLMLEYGTIQCPF